MHNIPWPGIADMCRAFVKNWQRISKAHTVWKWMQLRKSLFVAVNRKRWQLQCFLVLQILPSPLPVLFQANFTRIIEHLTLCDLLDIVELCVELEFPKIIWDISSNASIIYSISHVQLRSSASGPDLVSVLWINTLYCNGTVVEEGDEVILLDPAFETYRLCIILAGGTPVSIYLQKQPGWLKLNCPVLELTERGIMY